MWYYIAFVAYATYLIASVRYLSQMLLVHLCFLVGTVPLALSTSLLEDALAQCREELLELGMLAP